jgi:DNA-binding response OmpR family regulator
MLTARAEEADRLIGLELGADDYIVKPFSPRELVARVRAVLRRVEGTAAQPQPRRLVAGPLELDEDRREARLHGQTLDLTTMEFDLLAALISQPGRVFTRAQLLDMVQGQAFEGYERTIDVHVKNLRKKLGDDSRSPRYVLTVRGIGYKFVEE